MATPTASDASPSKKNIAKSANAPTAEAHHAAAQHHHIAAAHALETGKNTKAKEHAKAATSHTEMASDLNDDIIGVYEIWEY